MVTQLAERSYTMQKYPLENNFNDKMKKGCHPLHHRKKG